MPICQSCKDAAATGNMNLHCSEQQQCMCQHKSVEEYPTLGKDASHIAGNVDLTDTPQSGAKEVRNF